MTATVHPFPTRSERIRREIEAMDHPLRDVIADMRRQYSRPRDDEPRPAA